MNVHSHPVYAEQRAGLAEDSDDLFDLAVAHSLTDAAKHHQRSRLERWVVLECKPEIQIHIVAHCKCMFLTLMLQNKIEEVHTSVRALSTGLTTCRLGCPSYKPGEKKKREQTD